MNKYDPDNARGIRKPSHIPTKDAAEEIDRVQKAFLVLEKTVQAILCDAPEAASILDRLDEIGCRCECAIRRYNRVGVPVNWSELTDMDAVIRMADKNPTQFAAFDVAGLKKKAMELRRKGTL